MSSPAKPESSTASHGEGAGTRGWLQALLLPAIIAAGIATYWGAVDRDEHPIDPETGEARSSQFRPRLGVQEEAVRRGSLDRIAVVGEPVTAEDLSRIAQLPNLKTLTIGTFAGSEDDLAALEQLSSLETLHLHDLAVTDEGSATLSRIETLRNLNLDAATLGDEGLASLASLPKLELLRFRSPNVTDAGVAALAKSPALAHLHVIDAKLSDASLETIAAMERLESFYVDGGDFSPEGWRKFLDARPDVHVHVDSLHLPDDPQSRVKHD
ncbi:MAG TPA: hypothetical protein VGN57_15695 [Pirellulaceae bacterium]|jgi:hypothetical protein|nr:hypothetical protein [Pirellulaceae bacterium]